MSLKNGTGIRYCHIYKSTKGSKAGFRGGVVEVPHRNPPESSPVAHTVRVHSGGVVFSISPNFCCLKNHKKRLISSRLFSGGGGGAAPFDI